jgi:cleavage and polyadenylation specificity factor subunit 1
VQGIRDVRDMAFLHGYAEPVLLLLHEPDPTWPGLYK